MKRSLVLLLFISVLGVTVVSQQAPPGFGAASFARFGVDARTLGMGGAYVPVNTADPIPYYNPASLAGAPSLAMGGTYSEPYGPDLGIVLQSLEVIGRLGVQTPSTTGVGVGLTLLQTKVEDIPLFGEDQPGQEGLATFTSSLYLVSVGISVLEDWAIGGSVKLYRERVLEGHSEGIGGDLALSGSFILSGVPVCVNLNSMDIGRTTIHWRGTAGEPDNYAPWVNKVGLSASFFEGLIVAATDFDWAVGRYVREQKLHVGVEVHPFAPLFLRAGWNGDLTFKGSLSFGLGLRVLPYFALDYAYIPPRALYGGGHFLSIHLGLEFGNGQ